jgi:hypothetical protein
MHELCQYSMFILGPDVWVLRAKDHVRHSMYSIGVVKVVR